MARLRLDIPSESDSDGEFPSLAEIARLKPKSTASSACTPALRIKSAMKSPVKKGDGDVAGGVGGGEMKVRKKRVLNSRSLNPLLLPLGGVGKEGSCGEIDGGVRGGRGGRERRVRGRGRGVGAGEVENAKSEVVVKGRVVVVASEPLVKEGKGKVGLPRESLSKSLCGDGKVDVFAEGSESEVLRETPELSDGSAERMKEKAARTSSKRCSESIMNGTSDLDEPTPKERSRSQIQEESLQSVLHEVSDEDAELDTSLERTGKPAQREVLEESLKSVPDDMSDEEEDPYTPQEETKKPVQRGRSTPTIGNDSEKEDDTPKKKTRRTTQRKRPQPIVYEESDLDDEEHEDCHSSAGDDNLSDFIVDDSETLDDEDEESEMELPPPKSARRLVRGRKPAKEVEVDFDDEELDFEMGKLNLGDDLSDPFIKPAVPKKPILASSNSDIDSDPFLSKKLVPRDGTKSKETPTKRIPEPSSEIDIPYTLRYSPSPTKPTKKPPRQNITPPGSPTKPTTLKSPSKPAHIPNTPHRSTSPSFWAADLINTWNDTHSPSKKLFSTSPTKRTSPSKVPSPEKAKADRAALKQFSARKDKMAEAFLRELDEKLAGGEIGRLCAETGGVRVVWSNKLLTTAGRANWKRETIRTKSLPSTSASSSTSVPIPSSIPSSSSSASSSTATRDKAPQEKETGAVPAAKPPTTHRHHATIELSTKVTTTPYRLLNVLAHEFCHLTTFMLSHQTTNPHGLAFRTWAAKATSLFSDRGVEVTTKHAYEIEYKYVWECKDCGVEYGRHSKSVDTERVRCGVQGCGGGLVQVRPVPRGGGKDGRGQGKEGETGKKMGEYQAFVKEWVGVVRRENPGVAQSVVMGIVGRRYQEFKKAKEARVGEGVGGVEDAVLAGKMEVLDLTSP